MADDVDEPHQGHAARGGRRQAAQGGEVVGHERRLEEEVLGRVAGDGQLRKGGQVGAVLLGPGQGGHDPLDVAVDVTDDRVELAQGHTHAGHGWDPTGASLTDPTGRPAWHAAIRARCPSRGAGRCRRTSGGARRRRHRPAPGDGGTSATPPTAFSTGTNRLRWRGPSSPWWPPAMPWGGCVRPIPPPSTSSTTSTGRWPSTPPTTPPWPGRNASSSCASPPATCSGGTPSRTWAARWPTWRPASSTGPGRWPLREPTGAGSP